MNLEWTFVLFTHFGVTSGITQGFRVIPEVTPKWVNNTNVHSKFTLISLFSKIHSLKSEHIHSFVFREIWSSECDGFHILLKGTISKRDRTQPMIGETFLPHKHNYSVQWGTKIRRSCYFSSALVTMILCRASIIVYGIEWSGDANSTNKGQN